MFEIEDYTNCRYNVWNYICLKSGMHRICSDNESCEYKEHKGEDSCTGDCVWCSNKDCINM